MGKRNKERRAAKRRQRDTRRGRSGAGSWSDSEFAGGERYSDRSGTDFRSVLIIFARLSRSGGDLALQDDLEGALLGAVADRRGIGDRQACGFPRI